MKKIFKIIAPLCVAPALFAIPHNSPNSALSQVNNRLTNSTKESQTKTLENDYSVNILNKSDNFVYESFPNAAFDSIPGVCSSNILKDYEISNKINYICYEPEKNSVSYIWTPQVGADNKTISINGLNNALFPKTTLKLQIWAVEDAQNPLKGKCFGKSNTFTISYANQKDFLSIDEFQTNDQISKNNGLYEIKDAFTIRANKATVALNDKTIGSKIKVLNKDKTENKDWKVATSINRTILGYSAGWKVTLTSEKASKFDGYIAFENANGKISSSQTTNSEIVFEYHDTSCPSGGNILNAVEFKYEDYDPLAEKLTAVLVDENDAEIPDWKAEVDGTGIWQFINVLPPKTQKDFSKIGALMIYSNNKLLAKTVYLNFTVYEITASFANWNKNFVDALASRTYSDVISVNLEKTNSKFVQFKIFNEKDVELTKWNIFYKSSEKNCSLNIAIPEILSGSANIKIKCFAYGFQIGESELNTIKFVSTKINWNKDKDAIITKPEYVTRGNTDTYQTEYHALKIYDAIKVENVYKDGASIDNMLKNSRFFTSDSSVTLENTRVINSEYIMFDLKIMRSTGFFSTKRVGTNKFTFLQKFQVEIYQEYKNTLATKSILNCEIRGTIESHTSYFRPTDSYNYTETINPQTFDFK